MMRTWKTEMVRTCGKTEQDVVMRTWQTEIVTTCGEKDRGRCSNENMAD